MQSKKLPLSGWGQVPAATVTAYRPERINELKTLVKNNTSLIARGLGRAYGDEALNSQGSVILTERLDRIISFDEATREVVCEAGVSLADLLETFLPRGWYVPVSPGTRFVTVGGAIANDVHGKNHDKLGGFGEHLVWLDLLLASGEVKRITPSTTPELFAATVGGLGLTGIILQVCLRLQKTAKMVSVQEKRMANLDAFFNAFAEQRELATYSVGWIDALAKGEALGRGILETAEFCDAEPKPKKSSASSTLPFNLPSCLLNSATIKLFNHFYYRRVPVAGRTRSLALPDFLYPLDKIKHWNRLYGKKGFYQFQCVIPEAQARMGIRTLLETISNAGSASFLGVLKTLGGEGLGYLSFPQKGYTLALDFPCTLRNKALIQALEKITLDFQGRVYLAKDALLSPESFRTMYPRFKEFQQVLKTVDPQAHFQSDLARRLKLREEYHD